jgi:GntR family transcriptional regulator of vanillate catabolism
MKTRSERVADTLRDRILRGEFPAGAHLQEIPLSEAMGVSRTPVRSALQAIAAEGLLDYLPKRGYTVREFSLAEIETAHEVRANLEGMACRLAAERGLTAEDEAAFEAILARGDRILSKGRLAQTDRLPWIEMNDEFHGRILDCAGNRMLTSLVEQTYRVPLGSRRVVHWYDFQAVRGSHQLHHRIYRYIRDRKAVNAEALMREHILQAVEQIRGRTAPFADPRTESDTETRTGPAAAAPTPAD